MLTKKYRRVDISLYFMLIPSIILVVIYYYGPLFGLTIAFKSYNIAMGILKSPWAGLANFRYLFAYPNFTHLIWNTLYISFMKIIAGFIAPLVVALLLNEIRLVKFKKSVQTLVYLPHFISLVVISGIFINILDPTHGIVNTVLNDLGIKSIFFLGNPTVFPYVMVGTNVWKEFGFGTIIYMAALTGIDPSLYEAASIDQANRFQKIWHITLPGIVPIMALVGILSLGNILNGGFDQIVNLYNPTVYSTGDILDTYIYRTGLVSAQYDVATAVGLIKSIVSLIMVTVSYGLAYRFANYRIF